METKKLISNTVLLGILILICSTYANALTVTLESVSPEALDISDMISPPDRLPPPDGTTLLGLAGTNGVSYTAIFSVDEQPAVVVALGANVTRFAYDESTSKLTIEYTQIKMVEKPPGAVVDIAVFGFTPGRDNSTSSSGVSSNFGPGSGLPGGNVPPGGLPPGDGGTSEGSTPPEGSEQGAVEESPDRDTQSSRDRPPSSERPGGGPPPEAKGTYMSTNVFNWEILPPSADNPSFGFRLNGPKDTVGFFKMFIPATLLTFMGNLAGKELTAEDLAIFNEDSQASIAVTDVEGGALISIEATFKNTLTRIKEVNEPSSNIEPTGDKSANSGMIKATDSSSISKEFSVQEKEELSLAPTSSTITGKKVSLYGFVKEVEAAQGQKITILKKSGSKLVAVGKATVEEDGSYSTKVKVDKAFNDKKKSTLQARIVTDVVTDSTEVSLTRKISNSK